MKNITVSVDEETYRRSSIKAAAAGTSLAALMQSFLERFATGQAGDFDFERLKQLQEQTISEMRSRGAGLRSSDNSPREALHERNAVR